MTGKNAYFELDLMGRSYSFTGSKRKYAVPKGIEMTLYTSSDQVVHESVGRIKFFPDGSSTGGRIGLFIDGSGTRIDINWITGDVVTSHFDKPY